MKNVNPLDLGVNGEALVLKSRPYELGEDGKAVATEKYKLIHGMKRIIGKNGKPYLVTIKTEGETGPTYLVAAANTVKSSSHPVAYLKLLPEEEGGDSTIVCGLYVKKYDDGTFALSGKPIGEDAPSIQYYIAVDKFGAISTGTTQATGTNG